MFDFRTFILSGWCAFWIYWLVMAARTSKGGYIRRSWYAVFTRLAIIVILFLLVRIPTLGGYSLAMHSTVLKVGGTALFVAGLALAIWARIHLGRNWGMPTVERKNPELITSGPYQYIRHPIYTGILLAGLGMTITLSLLWLILFAVMTAYFVWSALQEEAYMTKRFPKVYIAYRQHSKMLIPFIV